MKENGIIVGIDLGTTCSLVSVLQDGRPVLLPNRLGEVLTPSAVGIDDDGSVLVGAPARARAATHPEQTVLAFKRDMGTAQAHRLGERTYRPAELSALVLESLVRDAEEALGVRVDEAVITVPAYFGDAQRQATRDAGAIAGLKVERIVNEPTAAALAYGLHNLDREMSAVVVDLGGGTFDVTVLEILEGVIEIRSSAGDARLGGEDFTDALAAHLVQRLEDEASIDLRGVTESLARVREAAEQVKRRLTNAEETQLALPGLQAADGRSPNVQLRVDRVEALRTWAALLERMRTPISRALRDANMQPADIEEVLMVGGATRMPCIVELAATLFGRMPRTDLPPDETVAQGAAVQAALKRGDEAVDDLVVTDVAPFTLGIATGHNVGSWLVDGVFSPIIERGTVIPTSRVQRFYTLHEHQQTLLVQVYQGEHSLCRDNTKLGEYFLKKLPRGQAGEVWVDVRFTYDLNGILEVELSVMGSARVEQLVIEKQPGRLSRKEIAEAREAMKRIKFHPRDSLPNRTALARADALYVESSGASREELGHALALFRTALESQEPTIIEPARERLNGLIALLRR